MAEWQLWASIAAAVALALLIRRWLAMNAYPGERSGP